jgi:hypothetical protein
MNINCAISNFPGRAHTKQTKTSATSLAMLRQKRAHYASISGRKRRLGASPSSRTEQHGSPAADSEHTPPSAATPIGKEAAFLSLHNLDINGEDAPSPQAHMRFVKPQLCLSC